VLAWQTLEQLDKAFLDNMIVGGQDFGDGGLPHGLHRDAIGQAVCLVAAGFIEGKAAQK
jgi:hypothetical protein